MTKQLQFYSDMKSSVQDVVEHFRGDLGSAFQGFPRPNEHAQLLRGASCLNYCHNLYLLLSMCVQVA